MRSAPSWDRRIRAVRCVVKTRHHGHDRSSSLQRGACGTAMSIPSLGRSRLRPTASYPFFTPFQSIALSPSWSWMRRCHAAWRFAPSAPPTLEQRQEQDDIMASNARVRSVMAPPSARSLARTLEQLVDRIDRDGLADPSVELRGVSAREDASANQGAPGRAHWTARAPAPSPSRQLPNAEVSAEVLLGWSEI